MTKNNLLTNAFSHGDWGLHSARPRGVPHSLLSNLCGVCGTAACGRRRRDARSALRAGTHLKGV